MFRYLFAAPLALMLSVTPAKAETTLCTPVTSLPSVISAPGVYCLTADMSTNITTGNAILVDANNVTLDCNGYKIGGLAGGPASLAFGIRSTARSNITVRNCNVRGFRAGIAIGGSVESVGNVVEDNRLDGNQRFGIVVDGSAGVVRRNIVVDTGSVDPESTHVGIYATPIAIYVSSGADVIDNTIDGVIGQDAEGSFAAGIAAGTGSSRTGSVIARNRIRGVQSGLAAYGIRVYLGRQVIRDNVLHAYATPTALAAIECDAGDPVPNEPVLVAGNTSVGFATGTSPACNLGNGNIFF